MGINTPLAAVPSATLGVNPVNPLGMASAFSAFATNGERTPPVAIEKITTATGKVVYQDKTEAEQVLEPAVASIVTGALEQVVQRGTGTGAQIGRPMAGKTGTAQEWRDAWFAGYTPALSAAVWVGYPAGEIEMKTSCANPDPSVCRPTRLTVTGGSWPAEIWSRFMSRALANVPADDFPPGPGLVTRTIDSRTGCLAGKLTPQEFRTSAQFVQGTEPKKQCRAPKNRVEVPSVVGFPIDEAIDILNNSGFNVDQVEEPTRQYPPGFVVFQAPGGGQQAREGSTVTLTVSVRRGSGGGGGGGGGEDDDRVTMPDVLGKTRAEAEKILQDKGFVVDIIYQRESNKGQARRNRDRVWKQSPPAGTKAEQGSEVTIWVNPP
jgi:penicillin-binding protein 1A